MQITAETVPGEAEDPGAGGDGAPAESAAPAATGGAPPGPAAGAWPSTGTPHSTQDAVSLVIPLLLIQNLYNAVKNFSKKHLEKAGRWLAEHHQALQLEHGHR